MQNIDTETTFYKVLTHRMTINDFEQWLYKNEQLDKQLPNNLYFDLISLNYTNEYVINELHNLLDNHVEFYKFEKSKIMECLQSIIDKDENCGNAILMTYNLYCDGYNFLRKLGLEYGLCLIDDYDFSYFNKTLKDKFYPNIIEDAENALNWFKTDKIIFKNEFQEFSNSYLYDDLRNETEILQGELTAVVNSNNNKPSKISTIKNIILNFFNK